ncbi:MAG TPA: zinc ribbon domain-containing protein [Dehalococcoidia bacterium]|nr:zinc ribbon domain-containing protein [Dehalococcoidia bacterium]
MPIYEYFCPVCKSKFELLRLMSEIDVTAVCPVCNTPSSRTLSKFACYVKDAGGSSSSVGGSSCSGCSATDCGSCGK